MKIKYFLQFIMVSFGLAGWVSASALAQQPLTYDMVYLNDPNVSSNYCDFLVSPYHQHIWLGCPGGQVLTSQEQIYSLFVLTTRGRLGKKIIVNLSNGDWGLQPEDHLIALTDDNQLVWLNLKTAEIVFLSASTLQKGDKPLASAAKRQALSTAEDAFAQQPPLVKISNVASLDKNTYFVLVKKEENDKEYGEMGRFWLLRLHNKGEQQWVLDDLTLSDQNVNEGELDKAEQNMVLNNQGTAILYYSKSPSLYCFTPGQKQVKTWLQQGSFDDPHIAVLPNDNFIFNRHQRINPKSAEYSYQAYRTIVTPQCGLVETAAWGLNLNNLVEALSVSPQGEVFLVYADNRNRPADNGDYSITPNALYLAKFTKENKLVWTKELIGRKDPWLPYLNLALPSHLKDAGVYNMQIAFSADGNEVLVLVQNGFQKSAAEDILSKDPKNLLPRIYRVPVK